MPATKKKQTLPDAVPTPTERLIALRRQGGWAVVDEVEIRKSENEQPQSVLDLLAGLLDSLPLGHPERPGVMRSIELIRSENAR